MRLAKSIGIIGGAAGPTAIFVAGKLGGGDVVLALAVVVALIVLGVWIWKKRKKNDL